MDGGGKPPWPPLGGAVPHTGYEWHSLLSIAREFPPAQLALYPSLPPLDPSCTLSTGRKKNRETAEKRPGRGDTTEQSSELKVTGPPVNHIFTDDQETPVTLANILVKDTFHQQKQLNSSDFKHMAANTNSSCMPGVYRKLLSSLTTREDVTGCRNKYTQLLQYRLRAEIRGGLASLMV